MDRKHFEAVFFDFVCLTQEVRRLKELARLVFELVLSMDFFDLEPVSLPEPFLRYWKVHLLL